MKFGYKDKRKKNVYERSSRRSRWLPTFGHVRVTVRITGDRGTRTETGVGSADNLLDSRDKAINRAVDDAVVSYIQHYEVNVSKKNKTPNENYISILKDNYLPGEGTSKGRFDRESMGITGVKILKIETLYRDPDNRISSYRRGGKAFTAIRDAKGRFVKGGIVRHSKDNSVTDKDKKRNSYGDFPDDMDDSQQ